MSLHRASSNRVTLDAILLSERSRRRIEELDRDQQDAVLMKLDMGVEQLEAETIECHGRTYLRAHLTPRIDVVFRPLNEEEDGHYGYLIVSFEDARSR